VDLKTLTLIEDPLPLDPAGDEEEEETAAAGARNGQAAAASGGQQSSANREATEAELDNAEEEFERLLRESGD